MKGSVDLKRSTETSEKDAVPGAGREGTPLGQGDLRWYILPLVAEYSAVIRPFFEDGGVTGALVGAIVDEDQVRGLLHGQQPAGPGDAATDQPAAG